MLMSNFKAKVQKFPPLGSFSPKPFMINFKSFNITFKPHYNLGSGPLLKSPLDKDLNIIF